jgi:predicted TIM-barrel fold metal-dependent hydrolase
VIIDAHTHVFPASFRERRAELCARDPLFAELYGDPRAKMATAAELLAAMDAAGVNAAIVCGFAWRDPALCRAHNDTLLEVASASGGRLVAFVGVSLVEPERAAAEVARCRALGARGVGELRPEAHGLNLADPAQADALAAIAGGLPLLVHASEPVGHPYPGKGGQGIGSLYRFLERHPGQQVIAAHFGGGLPLYAHMPEVRSALANVWVDTAAWRLLYQPSIFRAVADLLGAARILWATDYPLRAYEKELAALADVPLRDAERALILGANTAALLGFAGTGASGSAPPRTEP